MLLTETKEIKNTNSLVFVQCDYCGDVNEVIYKNHIKGRKNINKDSCKQCVGKKCAEITLIKRQEKTYEDLQKACVSKDYKLLSNKEDVVNNKTYISYACPIHGEHKMRVGNLLSGKGCPDCQRDNANKRFKLAQDVVVKMINDCGGELLNPQDYINNTTKNLCVTCPECGKRFITSLVLFTQHGGQKCDDCSNYESIGEMRIRLYLEDKNIDFMQYYWFEDCRDIKPLPFDFYIPDLNLIIEFDGRQHFEDTGLFSYSLSKTQEHDKIKNKYCLDNNIKLIRIPYTKINEIEKILDNIFT